MAWCHQATSHNLSQCWPSSVSPYGITRPQWVNLYEKHQPNSINSLRPRPNRRHFADDIFKYIFENENELISPRISLKSVPEIRINNIPALVQIMAWRRPGDKPLSEPIMVSLPTHICVTRPQWVKDALQFNDNQFTLSTCTWHLWMNLMVILQADCLTEVTNVKDLFKVRHSLDFMVFHFFITCYFTPHHTNHGGIVIRRVCLFACCVSSVRNGDTGNSFLFSDSCIIGEIMRMFS